MKTQITLVSFIVFLLLFSDLGAQTRFGIKGGLDRTNVRYYHPYSSSRYGFMLGGLAYIPINDAESLYLQPEVMYMQHGEKNVGSYLGGLNVNEKYYIDYVAVPVMLKAYFSDHYNTFFGEIGPQFAFKINQKTSSDQPEPMAYTDYGPDGDNVSSFDFSIGLGLGFSYERQWELGIRYNFGITDVYPDTIGENKANTNNSHTFALTLHYLFD